METSKRTMISPGVLGKTKDEDEDACTEKDEDDDDDDENEPAEYDRDAETMESTKTGHPRRDTKMTTMSTTTRREE